MVKIRIDKNIKAIAWDFDGTIFDSFQIVKDIVSEIIDAEGLQPITDEFLRKNFHGFLQETLHNVLGGNLSDTEQNRYLELFLDKQTKYYESINERLIEDALGLIERFKTAGMKQVLVTNRAHTNRGNASPFYMVENSVLKDAIGHVIAGDSNDFSKPDARVLEVYLKEQDLAPNELIVIGDQYVDGQLALNLDTKAILVIRDGDKIPHLEKLDLGWEEHVTIVESLHDVEI